MHIRIQPSYSNLQDGLTEVLELMTKPFSAGLDKVLTREKPLHPGGFQTLLLVSHPVTLSHMAVRINLHMWQWDREISTEPS